MKVLSILLISIPVITDGFLASAPWCTSCRAPISELFSTTSDDQSTKPADIPVAEVVVAPVAEVADAPVAEVAVAPVAEVAVAPVAEVADAPVTETAETTTTTPAATTEPTDDAAAAKPANVLTKPANNQPLYGKSLELPDTYVRCGRCSTSFAMTAEDLGMGKGRRVECSVCTHSWFQSRDRLMDLNQGLELVPLPVNDRSRIQSNIANNRAPNFTGNAKLYVGNLDFRATEEEISELFKTVGEVGETSLITEPSGRSRGFAFVTMMTKEEGDKAIEKFNGADMNGRSLSVKIPNN